MTVKKEDRRVKFTKMFLKNSLIDLLETKNMSKITIKEICEHADINRATFYAHFSDQDDLLLSIEEEYIERILADVRKHDREKDDSLIVALDILTFIYDNAKMSRILLCDRGDISFQKRIMALVHEDIIAGFSGDKENNMDRAEYISSFVIAGCIGIIQKWFDNDLSESPTEISELIGMLAFSTLATIDMD
jgi:AcrR family transcriptional regulator